MQRTYCLSAVITLCVLSFSVQSQEVAGTAEYYYKLGVSSYEKQKYEDAIGYFIKVIELDPVYKGVYESRALAFERLEKYKEAIADWTKCIELKYSIERSYYCRACDYSWIKSYKEAIADWTTLIPLNYMTGDVYRNRACDHNTINKKKEAIADWNKSIAAFTKSIQLDPKEPYDFSGRALSYYELGKYREALGDYTKAIQIASLKVKNKPRKIVPSKNISKASQSSSGKNDNENDPKQNTPENDDQYWYSRLCSYYNARAQVYEAAGRKKEAEIDRAKAMEYQN